VVQGCDWNAAGRPALRLWLTLTLTLTLTYFRPMMIDVTAGLVLVTAVVQHVWSLSRFGDLSDAHWACPRKPNSTHFTDRVRLFPLSPLNRVTFAFGILHVWVYHDSSGVEGQSHRSRVRVRLMPLVLDLLDLFRRICVGLRLRSVG